MCVSVSEGGGGFLCSGGPNVKASRALRPKDGLFGRGSDRPQRQTRLPGHTKDLQSYLMMHENIYPLLRWPAG